MKIDQHNMYIT